MTNEQRLWQRRAGILSEGEYMDSIEKDQANELKVPDFMQGKADPEAIKREIPKVYDLISNINSLLLKPPFTINDYSASEEIKQITDLLIQVQGIINKEILKEDSTTEPAGAPTVPENAAIGGVKTVQQLRQYFKDLGSGVVKLPTMDSTEVEQLHSFVKDFVDKAGKGSIGSAAKTVKRTFDTGTKSVKV